MADPRNFGGRVLSFPQKASTPEPAKPDRDDCCTNCFYAVFDTPEAEAGQCHANPPHVVTIPNQDRITGQVTVGVQSLFPPVGRAAWCGMFEPAIEAEPENP